MKNKVILGIIIVAAVISLSSFFVSNAEDPNKDQIKPVESNVQQRVYAVYVGGGNNLDENYVLQPLNCVDFRGIKCLTGKYVRKGFWTTDKKVYIPVDNVRCIVEFDSLDDYEKSVDKYTKQRMSNIENYYQPKQ